MMKPTPTTCIATSFGIPNKLHARGTRSSDPPATPDAPHALAADTIHRMIAVGISTEISSSNTAVLETFQNQLIWILAVADEYDDWVNNQCYEEYASYDYEDQSSVAKQNAESLLGDRIEDQAHNSEWSTVDDPSNGL